MKQKLKLQDYLSHPQVEGSPKVSIYMPTHRSMPEARQDPILFKNYIQQAQRELEKNFNRRQWEPLIKALEQMESDPDFWTYSTEGLAVLADEHGVESFRLEQSIPGRVKAGAHFDLVPLIRYYDTTYAGYLVDISRDRVKLYQVTQHGANELADDSMVRDFPELFDDLDYEAKMHAGGTRADMSVMHGVKAKPEEIAKDRVKYFRYVDEQLRKHIGKDTPVIIAGTSENVAEFKNLAKGDFYTEASIEKPFDSISHDEQPQILRSILRPRYRERIQKQLDDYGYQSAQGKTAVGLDAIAEAAAEHRIQDLFISGDYESEDQGVLNQIISQVISAGGQVNILTEEKLDDDLAASLRY